MGSMLKLLTLAVGGALLAGCGQVAQITPENRMCNFVQYPLKVDAPPGHSVDDGELSPFATAIEQSLAAHDVKFGRGDHPKVLSFSGGSEHGAFGAGILKGWGGDGDVPDLQVVTGISTGSILSTFAFVDRADLAVDGYTIERESQLINVYAKPTDGKPGPANFLSLIRKGAFGDLDPLRTRIGSYLTEDIMREVVWRHEEGRRLFVGVVDADSGQGAAFDMGDMAKRYTTNHQGKAEQWKDCYISAIIASSSTPMAAPPVFIDNIMYVDGGVRFGLFGDDVIKVFKRRNAAREEDANAPDAPVVYAVVNGTLTLPPPACPKEDPSLCTEDRPLGPPEGQHKNWNIMELALRSERILVNQVFRFSADSVEAEACEGSGCFNFLRIDPDVEEFRIALPNPLNGGDVENLTCPQWKAIDIKADNPIEFHKRYMRCLIAYGDSKVGQSRWGFPDS
ncbi:patatin-like phospholipase family protein [Parerythrobacter jejuensis]|uniref:PNPLA domain-containing protein n=1 Tax=Parerythrobacter jejuensis TaxID=795812 RepID=A0A845AKX4_9SPHN|nr:patatin-like phospholipase family protein [Parerythrobacter jejuensis]MXP30264.1 hypothetical protein [Parerythrobacter jejuensis]MXP33024.1 hypothetical protein [Parerythrobacter jejuensis]